MLTVLPATWQVKITRYWPTKHDFSTDDSTEYPLQIRIVTSRFDQPPNAFQPTETPSRPWLGDDATANPHYNHVFIFPQLFSS